ncbi:MAG: hypothetical protein ACOYJU_02310 [Anaerovoracaceae bacterium]
MKKEIPYFTIENSFGGDQRWFRTPLMRIGGCAAATACDSLILLSLPPGRSISTKKDYRRFAGRMRPYLYPRKTGVNTLKLFMDGFNEYLDDTGCHGLRMEGFSGEETVTDAKKAIIKQIDGGLPIPYLLLKHRNPDFKDLTWHWFILFGYEETPEDFTVTVATYGKSHTLSLSDLWDTGYEEKGGMILYRLEDPSPVIE